MQSEAVKEAVEALRYLNEGENHEAIGKAFEDVWNEHGAALLTLVGEKAEWFKCEVCEKHLPTEIGLQRHRRYHSEAAQSPAVEVVPDTVAGKVIYQALNRRESILSALKRAGFSIVELKHLKSPESE